MKMEIRQTATEVAELVSTVEYLREREEELSRYSDKLRAAITRIWSMFGSSFTCQICHVSQAIYDYAEWERLADRDTFMQVRDETHDHDEAVKKLHELGKLKMKLHSFVPKIDLSIDVEGEGWENEEKVRKALCINNGYMRVKIYDDEAGYEYYNVKDVSRETMKEIVRQGRITQLIDTIKHKLDETTEEYKQVSEIAEKFAVALE